ncbi:MAG: hypothetical protein IPQ07_27530 [Myxococcales bacterium]|nr:hypothetical protein [Myxococcales bacterium]
MKLVVVALSLVVGCNSSSSPVTGDDQPEVDAAVTGDAALDAPAVDDPTAGVDWLTWPEQQPAFGQASYGTDLVDIGRHLPASYGTQYWDASAITAAHETSHGIHAHLRNYENHIGVRANAFYVLGNKAALVAEPAIRKQDIKARIPANLRGPRYQLYLVEQTAWDDTPLYVFDEWNAYLNGAEVGIDQVQHGLYTAGWTDAVMGPLEFSAYAIATAKTVSDLDPTYFAANLQFRRFTAWNLQRAMSLFGQGRAMTQFTYADQDAYAAKLRSSPEAEPLRQFARTTWGTAWCQTVLGF